EHASGMLPDAMVPGAWMLLEALPLNANGKRDRGALPDPAEAERAHVAPRSPTEAALAEVWQEVLGVPWVGVTDDFFALGGHSLLALQLLARVRAALGVELALAQLLGDPTLGGVARAVDAGGAQGASPAPPPIRSVPRHGPLPLSFAQERLWFLQQMDPGDSSYVIPRVFRVRGPLDLRAMERTLAEVVRRHEVLRTTFPVVEGVPRQRVAAPEPLVLPVDDLSRLEPADREAALRRAVARELDRPFDLAAAPPLRVRCIRAGDGDHTLVLAAHHIAVDGVSMEVLAREISAIYPALAAGSPAPLPDPAVQYADYAVWQRGRLHGEALDRSLGWWTGQLAGVPAPAPFPGAAPADGPPPAARSCAAVLAADALRPLRALAAEEGATPFMALLAAFALALHRNTGQLDLCVGANASYRTEPELEGLVGLFLNQIVLRLDLSGDPTFRELLVRVRAASLGAYAHQEVPFERVVEAVRASRPGNAPLFRVKVDYQGTAGPDLDLPGLRIDLMEIPEGPAHGDLLLDLGDSCEDVTARVVWDPRAVAADVAGRILADTAALAEAAAASPDLAAGSLLDRLEAAEAERRGMQVKELEQATLGQLARLRSGARVRTSAGGSTQ
ncbi:MAG TPA: condensation domain-containing protein, partial [Longimicrobiaceae bacterium]|nr:condensation domain-containing protein [Longimicrobiaceae bacterium]